MMDAHPGDVNALLRITRTQTEISTILISRGDLAGADAHARLGLSVAQRYAGGPEHAMRARYLGNAFNTLAQVDRARRDWGSAREHAQQALDQWNDPQVTNLDPLLRQQASAVLAEASAHLTSTEPRQ